jgi:hypothetical protein
MYGTMARMSKTTVYLPEGLRLRMKRVAVERGESEAEIIRAAIDEFTAKHAPRPTMPLFDNLPPIEDWDEAMRGFGED